MLSSVLSFCVASVNSAAQDDISFSALSINDGLSQCTVRSVVQDRTGFMWIATLDGLDRFDGSSIEVFRHNPSDSTSIAANHINALAVDASGDVWAGMEGWFSRYDVSRERFVNYPYNGDVTALCIIDEGTIAVGSDHSLSVIDAATGALSYSRRHISLTNTKVNCIYLNGNSLYVGTDNGLLFWKDIDSPNMKRLNAVPDNVPVQAILEDRSGGIYVGTEGSGLYRLSKSCSIVERWTSSSSPLLSDYVRSLAYDSDGRLWIGTVMGLDIFHDGIFRSHTADPFSPGSLSHNSVRCIYKDSQDGMWLGTFYGGVNYWHKLKNRFRTIARQQSANSITDDIINCITADGDNVWIGTNGGGINLYDSSTGRFTHYNSLSPSEKLPSAAYNLNDIKVILPDSGSDGIWIGSHAGGLKYMDVAGGSIRACVKAGDSLAVRDVYSLMQTGRDSLIVGSLEGLRYYDRKSGLYSSVAPEYDGIEVFCMLKDSEDRLFIGAESGLYVAAFSHGKVTVPEFDNVVKGVSHINCIFESSSHIIWVGTRNGLWKYDPRTLNLKSYSSADGLGSDIIRGIEEDSEGRLWISTENGLCCFDPQSSQIRVYTERDGLRSNQFNNYAHCRRPDGEMWFGGVDGISVFSPERMSGNPISPQPVITKLYVAEHQVVPGGPDGILSQTLSSTQEIVLKNRFNSFSLSFTVPDNLSWGHSVFKYRLCGYDSQWHSVRDGRSAVYSNVPPGDYVFELKSANNDGVWCPEVTKLSIKVKPLWYNTWYAKAGFSLLALLIVAGIIWLVISKVKMQNRMRLEKQESEHQEELMQMKTRFFINMSHELRTPLTLIITPIKEMMARTDDQWMKKQLRYLDRNANRMLHLINQLMDYRRAELGVFKLKIKEENVDRLIAENCAYYERLAVKKHLRYSYTSHIDGAELPVDAQYIELILNNLLSNAFKYTEKGEVRVESSLEDGNLVISVKDSGIGVSEENMKRIFERFYQADSRHIGSGIGLSLVQRLVELHHGTISIDSVEGRGSVFTVRLPAELSAYSEEEINSADAEAHTTNPREFYLMDSVSSPDKQPYSENVDIPAEQAEEPAKGEKWKLLIVDDDAEMGEYLKNGMGKRFDITLASNGAEALEKLKTADFDLIITDMMMPVMDGVQLCTAVKRSSETAHIPVIMVSSAVDEKDQLNALHSGADDYISKPFSLPVLTAKARNTILSKSKIRAKLSAAEVAVPDASYNPADEEILSKAAEIVRKNMDNVDFSTEDFAREMHMSRSNLHLKIKAATGDSALEFIRKMRFEQACKLLREGRYTIAEISDKVGFATASYFTTSFRRYMGCLPKEYAKQADEASAGHSEKA